MKTNIILNYIKYCNLYNLGIYCAAVIVINILISPGVVQCMENDREIIKEVAIMIQQNNQERIDVIIENLRNIQDPIRIAEINVLLREIAQQYNINIDQIYQQNEQGLTIANPGLPQVENNTHRILGSIALFISITIAGYIIIRYSDTIRDFLFDISTQCIENVTIQWNLLGGIFRDPVATQALQTALENINNGGAFGA